MDNLALSHALPIPMPYQKGSREKGDGSRDEHSPLWYKIEKYQHHGDPEVGYSLNHFWGP